MNTSPGGITCDLGKLYEYTKSYTNSYGEKKE